MSWEHAGAIPPRWDFGSTLAFWSEGIPDRVNAPAARADSRSWLASWIRIALTDPDDGQRHLADRAVPWLLKDVPTRSKYQAVLDAVV